MYSFYSLLKGQHTESIKSNIRPYLMALGALAGSTLLGSSASQAQVTQLEHSASSYSGSIPTGPSVSSVKARFVNNTSGNTFVQFDPEINVTASFSDQQYNNVAGISNLKGTFFGGTTNDDKKAVEAQTVWRILNSISGPTNDLFTSNPTGTAGQGIDVNVNHGFNMYTSVEPLYDDSKSINGRYYYSKLTLTFNRAVSNPVLHIVGLGAWTSINGEQLGFSTELELENTSGISLSRLSGSSALSVANNKITNNKSTINASSTSGAATGSIRVIGNNITQLVFKIYLRGDGKGRYWSSKSMFSGDQWLMAFSMNASSISGNVFDDGNGLSDNKVNPIPNNGGSGTNIGGALYVNLIDKNNTIIASTAVGDDGGYVFQDVLAASYPATYKLVLTTSPTSKTPTLPTDWVFTGEQLGAPTNNGNDGLVDGTLNNISMTSATTVISNANFGINKKSEADPKDKQIATPKPESVLTLNGSDEAPAISGTDLEDGILGGSGGKVVITEFPTNGKLYYGPENNLVEITSLNQPFTDNFNPAYLKIKLTGTGYQSTSFKYAFVDQAGTQGKPASYTLRWDAALPVTLAIFEANKLENSSSLNWTTTAETNSDRFEIEYSTTGKNWSTIGTVAAQGESNSSNSYYFVHQKPTAGDNLYRLKMIDQDETFAYSRIINVGFDKTSLATSIYPNPAIHTAKISLNGSEDWNAQNIVRVSNMTGVAVFQGKLTTNELTVSQLPAGLYLVQVSSPTGVISTTKMIVKK